MKRLLIIFALCAVTHIQNSYSMAHKSSRVAPAHESADELSSSCIANSDTSLECLYELPEVEYARTPLHDAFYYQDRKGLEHIIAAIKKGTCSIDKNACDENGFTLKDYVINDGKIREYQEAVSMGFVREPYVIVAITISDVMESHRIRESHYLDMVQMILKLYGIKKTSAVSFNQGTQMRYISPAAQEKVCCTIS